MKKDTLSREQFQKVINDTPGIPEEVKKELIEKTSPMYDFQDFMTQEKGYDPKEMEAMFSLYMNQQMKKLDEKIDEGLTEASDFITQVAKDFANNYDYPKSEDFAQAFQYLIEANMFSSAMVSM